jgi:hypothetical protein
MTTKAVATGVYYNNVELTQYTLRGRSEEVTSRRLCLGSEIGRPLLPAPLLPKNLERRPSNKALTSIVLSVSPKCKGLQRSLSPVASVRPWRRTLGPLSEKLAMHSMHGQLSNDEKLLLEAAATLSKTRLALAFN